MKKSFLVLFLLLGFAGNYAYAEGNSIAVVDLQKLVSNSSQVKQLKQEHSKKMEELEQIAIKNIDKSDIEIFTKVIKKMKENIEGNF